MVAIRTLNEIILSLVDLYRVSLPDLDTKPGSVARDLFIEGPASQIALFYDQLSEVSNLQSLRVVSGGDLDKLAQNFGSSRKSASPASGIALMTFSSIPAIIAINKNDIITASNGITFSVANGVSINPAQSNSYRAIATKFKNDLDFLGITDQFAVEVSVRANTSGSSGNISKYSLNRATTPGISNITNIFPFTGGTDQETDASFRNRVLAIFSGSNLGTALGYKNLALTNSFIQDAIVITPGDSLMTRDGTIVKVNNDGSQTILSEGSGGKVDIIVLGTNLQENIDTFIYVDHSNRNDPTDSSNDIILGQISNDIGKTITQKRIDDITNEILPSQPIEEILEITGTSSGANFKPKEIDNLGRISGNFELSKDTGEFKGSCWALDKFKWISNKIVNFEEDIIKSKVSGQDQTTFTDILQITTAKQNISIENENSLVLQSDRSIIQLLHTPALNITRVFNTNTGERYTVTNQNLDGSGLTNITGRIKISGNTLPSSSDILQVDYTWIVDYDAFSDFDGKILKNNLRPNTDSIDWGIAHTVRNERIKFIKNTDGTLFSGDVSLPISSIIYANYFINTYGNVISSNIPNFSDRLIISLVGLNDPITNIETIKLVNTDHEIYSTSSNDGLFINSRVIINLEVKYNVSIILPTDTTAKLQDYVEITYNQIDTFNISNSTGSFTTKTITIPVNNIPITTSLINLDITYISSINNILTCGNVNLPISRFGNGFSLLNNTGNITNINSNIISRENQTIQKDISDNLFITLNISSSEFILNITDIITIIDLNTGKEIWSSDFPGTITIISPNLYKIIFSGFNSPDVGHNVGIFYFANDINRVQPFTFKNQIIKYNIQTVDFNFSNNKFEIPLQNFKLENNISFNIVDVTTGNSIVGSLDGSITTLLSENTVAIFNSALIDFSSLNDLTGKQLIISHPVNLNNFGSFNIIEIIDSHNIKITISLNNINNTQISIIRLLDNKELWNIDTSNIDLDNNKLLLSSNTLVSQGDKVLSFIIKIKNLHQAPTRASITVSDQIINTGILTTSGITLNKATDIVFTSINNDFKQNVSEAIKTFLNINSNSIIPSNKYIARVLKLERVLTTTNDEVLSVINNYDILYSKLENNILYSNEMLLDTTLDNTEFILPSTFNNLNNIPQIGDKLRISFYIADNNDTENVYFTRNGQLYTNKRFALINKIYVSSGFNNSTSTKITYSYFTQPNTGNRYKAMYDYTAPKSNERILIRSNFNRVIGDTTFIIESNRPINADVLVKAATEIFVDTIINIVIKQDLIESSAIIIQNVKDRIISSINSTTLGETINSSDLIVAAQSVNGVSRARIIYFNKNGSTGQVLTLQAQKNQFFSSNNIVINQETV